MATVILVASDGTRALWRSWRSSKVLARNVEGTEDVCIEPPLYTREQLEAYVSRSSPRDSKDWGAFLRTADFLDDPWAFDEYAAALQPFVDACDLCGLRAFIDPTDPLDPPVTPKLWGVQAGSTAPELRGELGSVPEGVWTEVASRLGFMGAWMVATISEGAHRALWGMVCGMAAELEADWQRDPNSPSLHPNFMKLTRKLKAGMRTLKEAERDIFSPPSLHAILADREFKRRHPWAPACTPRFKGNEGLEWVDHWGPSEFAKFDSALNDLRSSFEILYRTHNTLAVARTVLANCR